MAANVLLYPVVLVFLLVFPIFFFKHDQFHQGWTVEYSSEHTTKLPTGVWLFGWLFGRFAEHSSRGEQRRC